jgi:hypothetical protein
MTELPSPSSPLTPPCTPVTPEDHWLRPLHRASRLRRSHSLPGSPTTLTFAELEQLERSLDQTAHRGRRLYSTTRTRLDDDAADETFDARSDGSSSNDSAVDMRMKDAPSFRFSHRLFGARKYSVESSMLNSSWDGRPQSRTELMARCMEARLTQDCISYHRRSLHERHLHPDDPVEYIPRSYSSSESFMSLDESSMLSPTSSLSSYSETDSELLHTKSQLEFYEARLRSRERFQNLVRRWEEKQADQVAALASASNSCGGSSSNSSSSSSSSSTSSSNTNSKKDTLLLDGTLESFRQLQGIRERGEPGDAHLEKRFQELRKRWESKESIECAAAVPPKMSPTVDRKS